MLNIEPLNASYDEKAVFEAVGTALTDFYTALTRTLDNIDVDKILKRKNPYLYRAKGINSAGQIVDGILAAYITAEATAQGIGSCILGWFNDKEIRKICENKVFVIASDVSKYAGGYGMMK